MKILLVDDSRTMRNIQKQALGALGYTDIAEAGDGLEALAAVGVSAPDLIVLDWNMPNMSGIEFLKKFRQTNKSALVVMCTTEAEKSRVLEAIKSGANNYMIKPFTADTLKDCIEKTLAKRKAG